MNKKTNIEDYVNTYLLNCHNDKIEVRDVFNRKLDFYTRIKNNLSNMGYDSQLIKLYNDNIKFIKKAIKYLNNKVVNNKND